MIYFFKTTIAYFGSEFAFSFTKKRIVLLHPFSFHSSDHGQVLCGAAYVWGFPCLGNDGVCAERM